MTLYIVSILLITFLGVFIKMRLKKTTFLFKEWCLLLISSVLYSLLVEYIGYFDFKFTTHIFSYLLSFITTLSIYLYFSFIRSVYI